MNGDMSKTLLITNYDAFTFKILLKNDIKTILRYNFKLITGLKIHKILVILFKKEICKNVVEMTTILFFFFKGLI